jgi:condensin complex subunit 1
MAELLQILDEQYDYPQLTDDILRYNIVLLKSGLNFRDLSGKEFNNNDSKGPKSVATFLVKLSELLPRLVLKQMTLLLKLLDSEVVISNYDSDSSRTR